MSYLSTITSNIQNQINNCVHFTDLSYNNNLIFVSNMSYVNGIYNTLSSYIRTTNNNLNNAQAYNYLASTSISSNLYFTYVTKDLLQLRLTDYVTNT